MTTFEPIYGIAIAAGRALFGALRLKPRVEGLGHLPDSGGAVLAITHFGYLDFALVEWRMWHHNRRHIRFLAKKGAFRQPLIGALLRGMHHISVDMTSGAAAYAQAVDALRDGEVLGVFPEGGVNASFTVRDLKTGTVRMAAEAGVPIIPIAVWGGHRLLTKNRKPSLRQAIGTPVRFAIGEPFAVSVADDASADTRRLHDALQHLVDRLQTTYPVDGTGQWWQPAHLGGTAPTPAEAARVEAERQRRRAAERSDGA
ncbi:glycerol acyltransferase [Cryobacterium sp. MLB-32]|uniref:lysophospholipid acyltransferase family protein n=1 Tax=Cryobacterium sp. MLB-32 TaxID=1529318 RepID=UPI0004E7BABB|nr:lysophospholipid acyltransferase family protein [Cryobacterium sp. MLB-32]KFF60649.1 glycerol acyltransferase [Cryobacterium sp. MLB-32]